MNIKIMEVIEWILLNKTIKFSNWIKIKKMTKLYRKKDRINFKKK